MELFIVVIIILVLFGGSRLSEIGKGLGETIRNFREGMSKTKKVDAKTEKDSKK